MLYHNIINGSNNRLVKQIYTYSCSFLLKFNSNLHSTLTWKHKITHAVNVTIHCFFFLHFRGTNHIAGSRLSIGKAGVYSKEQGKKRVQNHQNTFPEKKKTIAEELNIKLEEAVTMKKSEWKRTVKDKVQNQIQERVEKEWNIKSN